jgi:hypothetical protein
VLQCAAQADFLWLRDSHAGVGIVAADMRGLVPYSIFNKLFASGADVTSRKLRPAFVAKVNMDRRVDEQLQARGTHAELQARAGMMPVGSLADDVPGTPEISPRRPHNNVSSLTAGQHTCAQSWIMGCQDVISEVLTVLPTVLPHVHARRREFQHSAWGDDGRAGREGVRRRCRCAHYPLATGIHHNAPLGATHNIMFALIRCTATVHHCRAPLGPHVS